MATKLRTFDFSKASTLTPSTEKAGWAYPWEDWLDGDIWQLTEGEDFQTHPLMMERIIRTRATSRKAKVRIKHLPLTEGADQPFGILVVQRTDIVGPTEAKKEEQKQARAAKKVNAAKEADDLLAKAGIKPKAVNGTKAPNGTKAKTTKAEVTRPSKTPSKRPAKVSA